MELKERSWNPKERFPNSLLQLSPATQAELENEYLAIYRDLEGIYDPQGLAEAHCVEMMATAMWCERRAISAETTAYTLEFEDQTRPENGLMARAAEGYSSAEQMAVAMARIAKSTNFYNFLLRYRVTQTRLYDSALRRLEKLKSDREKYARKLASSDAVPDRHEPSEDLERRMREHSLRKIQNEPKAA